ncbi:MAG: ABC transporter permease [Methanobacteriaceae archaeon]|nr:ABC transporter permease [Candidatus Methanorudis spinitermitis]
MINWALYKQGIKSNYKIVLLFFGLLALYITSIISMYNPEALSVMEEFTRTMPEIMAMVGMTGDSTTMMGYLITYLYGFIFLVIPFIVTVIIANNLVASYVDRGSMVYLLSSPNSRKTIIFTQMKVLGTFIFAIIAYCTILTIIFSEVMFPGDLAIDKLLIINFGLLILHIFLGGIAFASSTIFNDMKLSLMFGGGIPLAFFLIQMLSNMGGKLEDLKFFTIFTLFQPHKILSGETQGYLMIGVLAILAIILYVLAFYIFKKKDLSI